VSAPAAAPAATNAVPTDLRFLALGAYFGFVLIKAEVISWYRIQEMFRFDAFHMFGVIGSAIAVGALTVALVRRHALRAVGGRPLTIDAMPSGWRRYAFGGLAFGVGWALTGACPGPIAALIGAGLWPITIVFASALLGTYVYGLLERRLPH
jgi:uncharacterized membrane protein YedE/YeeE